MDSIASVELFSGIVLLVLSWLYLIVISFKDDYAWGFMTVFLPPLSYLYCLVSQPGKTAGVLLMALFGCLSVLAALI